MNTPHRAVRSIDTSEVKVLVRAAVRGGAAFTRAEKIRILENQKTIQENKATRREVVAAFRKENGLQH